MKISCNVIRDILPLYAEEMVSNDTKVLVDEHLCDCDECKKELDKICKSANLPVDADARAMKKVRKEIRKNRWQVAAQTLLIVLALLATVFNCLLIPMQIPTDEAFEKVYTDELGRLFVKLQEGTYNFVIHRAVLDGEGKETFHIYAIKSVWDLYRKHIRPDDLGGYEFKVGTGETQKIERVLFGTDDKLIWGNQLDEDVYIGSSLLQIVLAAAVVAAAFLTVLYYFLRKKKSVYLYTALLFWCYVAANIISIKLDFNSYCIVAEKEAFLIIALFAVQALLIYGAVMLSISRAKNKTI